MKVLIWIMRYLMGPLLFFGSAVLSMAGADVPACLLMLSCLLTECASLKADGVRLISLRMLFTVSWLGALSVTNLKLSAVQNAFEWKTWLSLGLFYFCFLAAYEALRALLSRISKKKEAGEGEKKAGRTVEAMSETYLKRLRIAIYIVLSLSLLGLLLEAIRYDFIFPIIARGKPHAYTEFHLSGVHYFVVTSVFVPALSVIYAMHAKMTKGRIAELLILNVLSAAVPVLLLSKLNLALFVAFPTLVYLRLKEKTERWKIVLFFAIAFLVLSGAFVLMVLFRDYENGYLEDLFAFKNREIPLLIQYPYMYVANNFENYNILVRDVSGMSYGLRGIFPFFALTGLKFLPGMERFISYEAVEATVYELTTVTVLYDAYGDFGLAGTAGFGLLLGGAGALISHFLKGRKRVLPLLLYMQFALYLSLSFFHIWFSLPTTWFWILASIAIEVFLIIPGRKKYAS